MKNYKNKRVFWKVKELKLPISWNEGYVFNQEKDMVEIGNDHPKEPDYHKHWYALKDISIKVRDL